MTRWRGVARSGSVDSTFARHAVRGYGLALLAVFLLASAPAEGRKICLWQVDGVGARVYLLGSIHAVKPAMYPLPAPMEAAFRAAGTLVVEVDVGQVSPDNVARVMEQKGTYPASESIVQDVSPETLVLLRQWLDEQHIPFDEIARLRPWLVSLKLEMRTLHDLGYEPGLGIDEYFLKEAAATGKPVRQLETWDEQMDLLSGDAMPVQDLELRATLKDLDHAGAEIQALVSAWQSGDTDALYRISEAPAREYPVLADQMRRLTTDRNHAMARKIQAYMKEGGTFLVVVGALHMAGNEGLVQLLARDFKVHQFEDDETPTASDH